MLRSTCSVILREQRESKDLRTFRSASRHSVRRSFDFGLRPSLRMTNGAAAPNPSPGEKVAPRRKRRIRDKASPRGEALRIVQNCILKKSCHCEGRSPVAIRSP